MPKGGANPSYEAICFVAMRPADWVLGLHKAAGGLNAEVLVKCPCLLLENSGIGDQCVA